MKFSTVPFLLCLYAATVWAQEPTGTSREAYHTGYSDGETVGRQDRGDGLPFNFANKRLYQRADRGFIPTRHQREEYFRAYRRGFEAGYEAGFGLGLDSSSAAPGSSVSAPAQPVQLPEGREFRILLLTELSTERNRPGDEFQAEVLESVTVGNRVAIPRGSAVTGKIARLKRSGRIAGRAEMDLQFERLELADGSSIAIQAVLVSLGETSEEEVRDEEGTIQADSTKREDLKKIGASAGIGALVGVLGGGRKGAAIGATAGAGVGVAGVLASRGGEIELPRHTEMQIRLAQPLVIGASTSPASSNPLP